MSKMKHNGYQSAIWFLYLQDVSCTCPCVTPDTLFNINTLAIMRDSEQNYNKVAGNLLF